MVVNLSELSCCGRWLKLEMLQQLQPQVFQEISPVFEEFEVLRNGRQNFIVVFLIQMIVGDF